MHLRVRLFDDGFFVSLRDPLKANCVPTPSTMKWIVKEIKDKELKVRTSNTYNVWNDIACKFRI